MVPTDADRLQLMVKRTAITVKLPSAATTAGAEVAASLSVSIGPQEPYQTELEAAVVAAAAASSIEVSSWAAEVANTVATVETAVDSLIAFLDPKQQPLVDHPVAKLFLRLESLRHTTVVVAATTSIQSKTAASRLMAEFSKLAIAS